MPKSVPKNHQKTKYPIRLRVYPDPEKRMGYYVMVNIWPTKKRMREFVNEIANKRNAQAIRLSRKANACSLVGDYYVKYNGKWRLTPMFSDVHLFESCLHSDVLSHELNHCAIQWLRRVRIGTKFAETIDKDTVATRHEEAFCTAQSNMMEQLVTRLGKMKIGPYK